MATTFKLKMTEAAFGQDVDKLLDKYADPKMANQLNQFKPQFLALLENHLNNLNDLSQGANNRLSNGLDNQKLIGQQMQSIMALKMAVEKAAEEKISQLIDHLQQSVASKSFDMSRAQEFLNNPGQAVKSAQDSAEKASSSKASMTGSRNKTPKPSPEPAGDKAEQDEAQEQKNETDNNYDSQLNSKENKGIDSLAGNDTSASYANKKQDTLTDANPHIEGEQKTQDVDPFTEGIQQAIDKDPLAAGAQACQAVPGPFGKSFTDATPTTAEKMGANNNYDQEDQIDKTQAAKTGMRMALTGGA